MYKIKKAQVPINLIPIVAIVLVVTSLYIFASFNDDFQTRSSDLSNVILEAALNKNYAVEQAKLLVSQSFEECPSCSAVQIKSKIKENAEERESLFRYEGAGNFYAKIRNNEDFYFTFEDNIYNLTIKNLFVQSQKDYDKIKKNFDICLLFNNKAKFIREC